MFSFRKWLVTSVTLLSISFFFHYAARNFENIPPLNWNTTSTLIALFSVTLIVCSISIVGTIWNMLLRDNGISTSWKQAQIIFAIAQFGKYLPGNVGQHVGRVVMAREIGIPVPITLSTMLVEMLWGAGIGAGLAVLSLILFIDGQALGLQFLLSPIHLGIGVVFLLFMPWLGIGFLNRYLPGLAKRLSGGAMITVPRLRTALMVAVLFLLCFAVMGLILKLQAQWFFGVTEGSVFKLTCLFAIAWLAGYIVPGAPGGLGVREAMMVLVLSPVLGAGAAVGLGVTLRVTTTMGDAAAFLLGIIGHRLMTSKHY
ncbi:lysylphosphatidylglycerol synthase domain-containing protein [Methylobacter sp. YRD-M1]|uniref:lysylphosphatidylglycerol synthase domain-containing protein n=1 Tax=Methylobacter sp. YRD-M1 TaxID=2911520 RepID=UPI00227BA011|nr:lysylphosphatidylglycerol synthase domain-containing protein [Methylobacter sp. YRD-M1]WAK02061.1 lysylphosphatidylglycerol synthase domain-containing protein [Methylobacter sp. YRD-M1]